MLRTKQRFQNEAALMPLCSLHPPMLTPHSSRPPEYTRTRLTYDWDSAAAKMIRLIVLITATITKPSDVF
jgi:hypothetical protein